MLHARRWTTAAVMIASLGLGGPAQADTLNVPDEFATIQEAIDFASNGDEVVVAMGTYRENIDFIGKAILLRSTDPTNAAVVAATIIDGGNVGTVVTCANGEGPDSVLNGFTVMDGSSTEGGGMHNDGSNPTVMNCIFSGNSASDGGGMFNNGSSPTVINCVFNGNNATDDGGGMFNVGSSPTVTDCRFIFNQANSDGGGMYNVSGSSPIVTDCTFGQNGASSDGGGMANCGGSLTITNCTFSGNSAVADGGGMINFCGTNLTVINCTFSQNTATAGGGIAHRSSNATVTNCTFTGNVADSGAGIYNQARSSPTVTNCTFSSNFGFTGGGMYNVSTSNAIVTHCTFSGNTANLGGAIRNSNSQPTVTNCILWGDSAEEISNSFSSPTVSFSNVQGGLGEGTLDGGGNIDADPLFVDPDNDDLHLLPGSPCIDAANNDAVPADVADLDGDGDTTEPIPFDLDGNPRFQDDPAAPDCPQDPGQCGDAPIVDMGPYEFGTTNGPCEGDANGDGTVDPLDTGFVLSRFGCEVGAGDPNCDAADANTDGAVDPLDVGFILARFGECV